MNKYTIDNFKTKAREFWAIWNNLSDKSNIVAGAPVPLQREYRELMDRGVTVRKTIERVTAAIDSAAGIYNSAVDYTSRGMESAINWFKGSAGLGGIGLIPLVPVAVIAVALAAMGKWIKDAYVINKKISVAEKLINQGVVPEKAFNMAGKMVRKNSLFNLGFSTDLPTMGIIALIGFIIYKKVVK